MNRVHKLVLALGAASALLTAFLAAGCMNDSGDEASKVRVWITDAAGAAHPADTVYWSYSPHLTDGIVVGKAAHGGESDTVLRGAACANADCSEWEIREHVHGELYIRARYSEIDPFCTIHAFTVKHVDADTLSGGVTVVLKGATLCL